MFEESFNKPEKERRFEYDVIVVLSGGISKRSIERLGMRKDIWKTMNFSEGDAFGALGGRSRMIAARCLFKKGNVAEKILTSTGKPKYIENESEAPAESEVMRDELVRRGVPEEDVLVENESKNTRQNFENILKIAKREGWRKLLIITNRYHIPRASELFRIIQEESGNTDIEAIFQEIEEILIQEDPRWSKVIEMAYESEEMKRRIANEEKGLKDLREGRYKSIQEENA